IFCTTGQISLHWRPTASDVTNAATHLLRLTLRRRRHAGEGAFYFKTLGPDVVHNATLIHRCGIVWSSAVLQGSSMGGVTAVKRRLVTRTQYIRRQNPWMEEISDED